MKRRNASYDNYYKHKLNMLEPGSIMLKLIGALLVIGGLFWVVKWQLLCCIALCAAGAIFAVLLVLLAIESHQDRVLNEIAMEENRELEREK